MMCYLKIVLILIVITLQISEARPGFWTFDGDNESTTGLDVDFDRKETGNKKEITGDQGKTKSEDNKAIKSNVPAQKKIALRKGDLEFLESVYKGKGQQSHKEMSDKIYEAFGKTAKRASQQLKLSQMFKAYVQTAHNRSEGVSQVYEALKTKDIEHFLHDWYKMDYKGKKGEIHEVEKAIKHDEQEATRATECVTLSSEAPTSELSKVDEEVNQAANKAGLEHYSKEHLIKDLVDEHRSTTTDSLIPDI